MLIFQCSETSLLMNSFVKKTKKVLHCLDDQLTLVFQVTPLVLVPATTTVQSAMAAQDSTSRFDVRQ